MHGPPPAPSGASPSALQSPVAGRPPPKGRGHLTTPFSTLSKPGVGSSTAHARPAFVLGFSITNRYAGLALVVQGEPVVLASHRLARSRRESSSARLAKWVHAHLARYRVAVVAFIAGDECDGPRATEGIDVLRRAFDACGRTPFQIGAEEIARVLGLTRATRVAVGEALAERHPLVAARLVRSSRCRTESERYWEISILAAGAALAAFELLA